MVQTCLVLMSFVVLFDIASFSFCCLDTSVVSLSGSSSSVFKRSAFALNRMETTKPGVI